MVDTFGKYVGNEKAYVEKVLDSEDIENKKETWVSKFEAKFAQKFGANYAVAHNSGTSTLHTCLAAAGVGYGDEVISPAQTVIMVSFATLHQNAIPVYVDIDPETFNISPDEIERNITEKTKAIIAVHMHGLPADMNRIMEIGNRYNIPVIEDCAQCVLAKVNDRTVGTIGDMASFSFETKKHMSTGEGGMVITNSEPYAEKIRKVGGLGYKTLTAKGSLGSLLPSEFQNPEFKRHDVLGWNYRMNELTAAVGLAQLERVDELVERRIKVANLYLEELSSCNWMVPQKVPHGLTNSYWTFAVKYYGNEEKGYSWYDFYNLYKELGGVGFYGGLSVAYREPIMQDRDQLGKYFPEDEEILQRLDYTKAHCPNAEDVQGRLMQFKTNYRDLGVAKEQIRILGETIRKIEGN